MRKLSRDSGAANKCLISAMFAWSVMILLLLIADSLMSTCVSPVSPPDFPPCWQDRGVVLVLSCLHTLKPGPTFTGKYS